MVFLLITIASPEEPHLDGADLMIEGFRQAVEAHNEQEQAGQGGVDKDRPCRLRQPPTLPRFYAMLELEHNRPQVCRGQA